MNVTRSIILTAIITSALTTALMLALGYGLMERGLLPLGSRSTQDSAQPVTGVLSEAGAASIPDIVERSAPAVVSIVISADVPVIERYYERYQSPFGQWFGDGFEFEVPSLRQIGTERQEIGGGTGFFVSPDGYLITNRHVVDDDDVEYSIVTDDGTTYDVDIVAKDPSLDIAILKVTADGVTFPYLEFAESNEVRLGETVIAIGNALTEFPNSVSAGVVSGLSRNIVAGGGGAAPEVLEELIQTDAAINRGNSGGPLINARGEVVGVNVATSGFGENIGFALPASLVASAFTSVKENGEIVRPFLGVRYVAITKELAERNELEVDHGVLIVRGSGRSELAVVPGSPADKAGLEENDIITAINGEDFDASRSLTAVLRAFEVGETITLTVLHDGKEKEVQVTLEKNGA